MKLRRYQLYQHLSFAPLLFQSGELHFRFNKTEPQLDIVFVEWELAIPSILDCIGVIIQILLIIIYRHDWIWCSLALLPVYR